MWDDASVFGDLETSIERLIRRLNDSRAEGVVTHSFGDWLFRRAAARRGAGAVKSLVSLVPVMTSSLAARLLEPLRVVVPEVGVMADEHLAASDLQTPPGMDRLVVWSRVDPWVSRIETDALIDTRATTVAGTHNTVLWQPGVQNLCAEHLLKGLGGTRAS